MKPALVYSHCLGERACRYDGQALREPWVNRLAPHVTLIPVCPEVSIGLGVPRDPIHLVASSDGPRLLQPSTGRDVSGAMHRFASSWLGSLGQVDGFLLKSRSPSCGVRDVRVRGAGERGPGMFGAAVMERFPHAAVEDEGRLSNAEIRDRFFTRLWTNARWREARRRGTMGALVSFQARHKLLFMACSERSMRELGRIVANHENRPPAEVAALAGELVGRALGEPARRGARVNAYQHAFGYASDQLSSAEKRHFESLLERYHARRTTAAAVVSVIRSWIERFDLGYLRDQVLFEPYPEELVDLSDSGKGRD